MALKKINIVLMIAFLAFSLVFYSCEKVTLEKVVVEGDINFTQDIVPIFTSNCIACHSGSQKPNLTADKAFSSLTTGNYFNVTTPEDSKIYKKLISGGHETRASDVEKQKILLWIQQGAKND